MEAVRAVLGGCGGREGAHPQPTVWGSELRRHRLSAHPLTFSGRTRAVQGVEEDKMHVVDGLPGLALICTWKWFGHRGRRGAGEGTDLGAGETHTKQVEAEEGLLFCPQFHSEVSGLGCVDFRASGWRSGLQRGLCGVTMGWRPCCRLDGTQQVKHWPLPSRECCRPSGPKSTAFQRSIN